MSYVANFADTRVIRGIQTGDEDVIESDIFRFEVPPSVIIDRVIGNNDIGLDPNREFFELHLYERGTTNLVTSVVVPFSEGYLYIREGAPQNVLRLGLTFWPGEGQGEGEFLSPEERAETFLEKYLSDVPFGVYDCIINFFSNELGTYNEDEWQIKQISDSRREVILERNPETEKPFDYIEYQQFSYDSVFGPDFEVYARRLFQYGQTTTEFQILVRDFVKRLFNITTRRELELFQNFDGEDQELIRNAFRAIYKDLIDEIIHYVENEIEHRRYRIIRENFNQWIEGAVYEVVRRHIDKFPEPGILFVVDKNELEDPAGLPDDDEDPPPTPPGGINEEIIITDSEPIPPSGDPTSPPSSGGGGTRGGTRPDEPSDEDEFGFDPTRLI